MGTWTNSLVFRATAGMAACLIAWSPAASAQEQGIEGQRVAEVRVIEESGRTVEEQIPPLPLAAGKPFDLAAERESLRELYHLGDYSNIRVTAAPGPGGLQVDFIVRRNFYNNLIRVEGLRPPPAEAVGLASLRLRLGEPFRESSLREAVERLQGALRDDGLYLAKVTWRLVPHEDTRQMDVTVVVDPGPRARLGDISVENRTPYADQELLHRSKLSQKNEMTSARVARAAERLKKFLVNQGYLGAGAVITAGTYDAATNRVPLKLAVNAGPRVRIEISGAHLSESRRRKLLPVYAEGGVDEDLLQEGRRNLRDYFQREGYFGADVNVRSRQDDQGGQRVISYEIARGDRFRLVGVAFDGNRYFGSSLLARRLQLQPASFASSGHFSQQLMRADVDSIRALYLANGFQEAQVSATVDDHYRGKKNNMFVSFHVVEGRQTRIAALQMEGNRGIATDTLLGVTGSTPGQPYSELNVTSDRNNILALYFNEGFPQAALREEVLAGEAPAQVRLIYHITEGTRTEVAGVLLTGYQHTRRGIIARQVEIQPAGPLRVSDVARTQRQLYNLGVFSRVQIAPQNPDGSDSRKTVVVEVREGQRYTIAYGAGFEVQSIAGGTTNPGGTTVGASPRGIFEIARANMFGRAQTLSLKARASTLEYRFALGYSADGFLTQRRLSLAITGFADHAQDVNTFTSTRYEGGVQLGQKLSLASSLSYRYFYRRVEASNLKINPQQIPLLSQPTLVSGFGITYARDRRDNPADAKRGTFNTLDVSYALKPLGSGASFFRASFQNSSFHSFGRSFVFARSVRFGAEVPAGTTANLEIPLPERFFAGGGTSLRGFGLNQAGPRDEVTGFPIGGLGLLVFNQELRFPTKLPVVGNRLGGTFFYDGGNVYSDVNHISLAWKAPSVTNLNYFSHTVGVGLRYPTPVGPVRVDFGYQINPATYLATNPVTHLPETFRLPHFGFFFNIGPVF
ncbi:MAG: BamA/TamA family outer membrane protein [Acidobacteriia bacterium]|nr:BamA/TamA family outer membrane protein [Terriglobia bacterium]